MADAAELNKSSASGDSNFSGARGGRAESKLWSYFTSCNEVNDEKKGQKKSTEVWTKCNNCEIQK